MVYSFQLWKHPNIHYREAVQRLGRCELFSMLRCLSVDADIQIEIIGSAPFFTFESRTLSPEELTWLRGHSGIVFMAEKKGGSLLPLSVSPSEALSEELPEVLKYKGKTSPSFTRMMLNTAMSLTPFARHASSAGVLAPLCGKGTGLFCALCSGASAVGIDISGKDLREASDYFRRFLKLHRVSHTSVRHSETAGTLPVPAETVRFSLSKEKGSPDSQRFLTLYEGDTSLAGTLLRKKPAHALIADLPYGVQHAPQSGKKPEPFDRLLSRALPAWKEALRPGGALAVSFNTLTLKTETVRSLLAEAGFLVCDSPVFSGLIHSVEQAVVRDLVFATVPNHSQA